MRTTVDLDAALLKRLRVEARRKGLTVKEFLATVLRRGLDEQPPRRTRYRCPSFSMGEPARALDKALGVASELEDQETARELGLRK